MLMTGKNQRGDTLIEVLIAITVLGAIVSGCMAVMNRSLISILNSAERTASRADINSQTDLINYVSANRDGSTKDVWDKILKLAVAGTPGDDVPNAVKDACILTENSKSTATVKAGSFYLEPTIEPDGSISKVNPPKEGLKIATNGINQSSRAIRGQGLWVDAIYYKQTATNKQPYIDFYIKACWVPFGGRASSTANTRSVTVVRIYIDASVALIHEKSGDIA
jgi:prepilin-type N-terminal cleavage/methylation domain-containing protein